MSHARTAAKVRRHKEDHPALYCSEPRCLWRVVHNGGEDTPCRKHPNAPRAIYPEDAAQYAEPDAPERGTQ